MQLNKEDFEKLNTDEAGKFATYGMLSTEGHILVGADQQQITIVPKELGEGEESKAILTGSKIYFDDEGVVVKTLPPVYDQAGELNRTTQGSCIPRKQG